MCLADQLMDMKLSRFVVCAVLEKGLFLPTYTWRPSSDCKHGNIYTGWTDFYHLITSMKGI